MQQFGRCLELLHALPPPQKQPSATQQDTAMLDSLAAEPSGMGAATAGALAAGAAPSDQSAAAPGAGAPPAVPASPDELYSQRPSSEHAASQRQRISWTAPQVCVRVRVCTCVSMCA